jgi:ATP-dependent RNA helicase DeaD
MLHGISGPLGNALAAKGYEELTAVQAAVIADGVAGRDLLVSAQTGSGKTVAFGLAMAPEILGTSEKLLYADVPLALIIAPTRELALQVARELEWLYATAGAKIATCVGGMDYRTEKRALERGAHIVVGTPGRLRDHIERRSLDLSGLRAAVLDEADEMLDLGFAEDLEFILAAAPDSRRTLMFSATVPREIETLARTFQKDALRIQAQGEAKQHVDIEYRAMSVAVRDKEHAIFNILRFYEAPTAIVFCKTRVNVNHLMARMGNRGFQVVALSGELSQQERTHALQSLRDGRARVCIATDVAARGIDLPGLELVIHADLPQNSEIMLHRSGRTGRAGKKGVSVLLATPTEFAKAQRILKGGRVVAEWGKAPGADDVQEREDARLLEHPLLSAGPGEEADTAAALVSRYGAESVAAAFIRLWREGRSAPEVLSDNLPPVTPREPRERGEFGASVWYQLSVGRSGRAEARWLLPKICDAGGIAKDSIGAIRVQEDVTFVQLAEAVGARFGAQMELEAGLTMERIQGEPSLDRPERSARPERGPRPDRAERSPRSEPRAEPRSPRSESRPEPRPSPRADAVRSEKPAYVPKPARIVEDDAPAARAQAPRPLMAERAAPRAAFNPDAPRADARPPRNDTAEPATEKKARWKSDEKPAYKSAGFKSHGGAGKPARAGGFKSHASEGAPWKPKGDGDRPAPRAEGARPERPYVKKDAPRPSDGAPRRFSEKPADARSASDRPAASKAPWSKAPRGDAADGAAKRPYAPKGDGARPFVKRDGPKADGKPGGAKFGKPAFGKPKPAAPRGDAKDTSKRFVPPKKPKT